MDESSPCAPEHSPSGCGLIGVHGVLCALTAIGERPDAIPETFYLGAAVPNPFNPTTEVRYGIPVSAGRTRVVVDVCDVLGRHVRTLVNREEGPGEYRIRWDGKNDRGESAASGVYFFRLEAGTQTYTRKGVLLK